ncbi:hypothetical protein AB0D04_32480 [Streptomyces sp. NPDC048483]|uniref:hypothetical protein n=1 Tax=Streptomyces sp. NPDC048483 TaxID=3154927 RepID=UPI003433E9F2
MTKSASQEQQTATALEPGTYVFDVVAHAVGRIADPEAYPREQLGAAVALVVPLTGSAPAWQAEPGSLRLATAAEIEAAR